jgi:hypothetical protein
VLEGPAARLRAEPELLRSTYLGDTVADDHPEEETP